MKRIVHIGFARKIRDKAMKLVAHLLEVSENGLKREPGKFFVKGAPQKSKTIHEIAFAPPPVRREGRGVGAALHCHRTPATDRISGSRSSYYFRFERAT